MRIRIRKGLDIPLGGAPKQTIDDANPVDTVAVLGPDTLNLKPAMAVAEGDRVTLGQPLFSDRRNPDVPFTAPGAGVIHAIHRGARRSLQSVVIRLEGDDEQTFASFAAGELSALGRDTVRTSLLASGMWTAIRARPFGRIPAPDAEPRAVFVTAIDSNPHAPDPSHVIDDGNAAAFVNGLQVVARLTDGPVYVCTAPDSAIPLADGSQFRHAEFCGPHPAGLVGTHIHFLHPVGDGKSVWHLGYQDVIAIGRLFTTGRLHTKRIIALGGPMVRAPRLLRTRLGACVTDLVQGELAPGRKRLISGSVLSGRRASGQLAWLGRYHNQVSVVPEGGEREFLAWARPGMRRYSAVRAYASHLFKRDGFELSTSQNGSPRAMVSIGTFEKVMPLDILATPLLKALLVQDTDAARELGCLELEEEDLALCSFVCNGKYEYGPFLRMNLDAIEVDG